MLNTEKRPHEERQEETTGKQRRVLKTVCSYLHLGHPLRNKPCCLGCWSVLLYCSGLCSTHTHKAEFNCQHCSFMAERGNQAGHDGASSTLALRGNKPASTRKGSLSHTQDCLKQKMPARLSSLRHRDWRGQQPFTSK